MNDKKQTAVEWLAEKYDYINWMRNRDEISQTAADKWRRDFLEIAKAMEKEQIEDAYKADLYPCSDEDAEQYYKETYK